MTNIQNVEKTPKFEVQPKKQREQENTKNNDEQFRFEF
jgi:hypothetical protein